MPQVNKATFLPLAFWTFVLYIGGSLFWNSTYLHTRASAKGRTRQLNTVYVRNISNDCSRRASPPSPTLGSCLIQILAVPPNFVFTRNDFYECVGYVIVALIAGYWFFGSSRVTSSGPDENGMIEVFTMDSTNALVSFVKGNEKILLHSSKYAQKVDACQDVTQLEVFHSALGAAVKQAVSWYAKTAPAARGALHHNSKLSLEQQADFLAYSPTFGEAMERLTAMGGPTFVVRQLAALHAMVGRTLRYYEVVTPYDKAVSAFAHEAGFLTYDLHTNEYTLLGHCATVLLVFLLFLMLSWLILDVLPTELTGIEEAADNAAVNASLVALTPAEVRIVVSLGIIIFTISDQVSRIQESNGSKID